MRTMLLIAIVGLLNLYFSAPARAESRATGSGWIMSGRDLPPSLHNAIRAEFEQQERFRREREQKTPKAKPSSKRCRCIR